jgi:peptide/nickel transport system permease protein
MNRGEDGELLRVEPPSSDHWFGTNEKGQDVFSQTIVSTRISLMVGILGALMSMLIGTTIGIVSGYYGGRVDDVLMRITDIAYGLPFLPFIIVLVLILGPGLFNVIFAIALIMWRPTARVVRSQVLTVKERPFVEAAEAAGASNARIMAHHILPNILPIALLYSALSVAWAISVEASIAFIGFGDPDFWSWGKMMFEAFNSGLIREAWWWIFWPGFALSMLVVSVFFITRAYEKVTNPDLSQQEG